MQLTPQPRQYISLCLSVPAFPSFSFLRFYLFIHDREREREREREAETQAEEEAGSMPGAPRGTGSRDSRIVPWAKGRCETAEPPRDPLKKFLYVSGRSVVGKVSQVAKAWGSLLGLK